MWIAIGLLALALLIALWRARQGEEKPKGPEPSPITELTLEMSMSDARIAWVLPTTRESGLPLAESEIQFVEILMSADGGTNYVIAGAIAPPILELVVSDLDVGMYHFKAVVVDSNDRRSADSVPVIGDVLDTSPPSGIASMTVTIE